MTVSHANATILTGRRDAFTNRLWQVALPPAVAPPSHWANAALHPSKIKELVAFSHACLGSPVPSTLETALDATSELQVSPVSLWNLSASTLQTLLPQPKPT